MHIESAVTVVGAPVGIGAASIATLEFLRLCERVRQCLLAVQQGRGTQSEIDDRLAEVGPLVRSIQHTVGEEAAEGLAELEDALLDARVGVIA